MKSGNLNFLEPSGPLQACNGTALPLRSQFKLKTDCAELPATDANNRSFYCTNNVRLQKVVHDRHLATLHSNLSQDLLVLEDLPLIVRGLTLNSVALVLSLPTLPAPHKFAPAMFLTPTVRKLKYITEKETTVIMFIPSL